MIFDSLINFCKKTYHAIFNPLKQIVTLSFDYQKITGINFDSNTLLPPHLNENTRKKWLTTYLQQFDKNSLLLWADEKKQLNVSYSNKGEIIFQCLPLFHVNPGNHKIIKDGEEITTLKEIINALAKTGLSMSSSIFIPTADKLSDMKIAVHIKEEKITKEVLDKVRKRSRRALECAETDTECPICYIKYDNANPPFILEESKKIYHKNCIEACFKRQRDLHVKITDPFTDVILTNQFPQVKPAMGFHAMRPHIDELCAHLKILTEVAEIQQKQIELLEKNQSGPSNTLLIERSRSNNVSTVKTEKVKSISQMRSLNQ